MGIFEKSIPKYVINPIEQNVQIAPQPYVVDDIFDPIFNANVRNALRQKYGSSLAGVGGGYAELLENAWGGDTGIFGKGMGVLSTFGRSMEKADDLVLGLLTEGVEGISGQGFDNPFKEIFVNDVDYTGKRFLASTANIGRNIVGTTVDESDFGTAWNLPALGIELGTDVGILGGGLARKFAPAAKDFTSKQLFERLGKSDLKTTVGEVGQLMSNYDDLMAKVAIDITAPGLRPAFKSLGNKLAQLLQTQSPEEYFDIEIIKRNPKARKIIKEWLDEHPTARMIDNVNEQMSKIPTNAYEEAQFWGNADDLEWYDFVRQAVETGDFTKLTDEFRKYSASKGADISARYNEINSKYAKGFDEMLDRFRSRGINVTQVGVSRQSDDLFDLVNERGNDIDFLRSLKDAGYSLDDLRTKRDFYEEEFYRTGSSAVSKTYDDLEGAILAAQRAKDSLNEVRKIISDAVSETNPTYVDEVLEKLDTDDALIDALKSGEWSTNAATNSAVESLLKNPSYQSSLWYASANPKFRISPSRFVKLNAFGAEGASLARAKLEIPRHFLGDLDRPRFSNVEELDTFLKTPKVEKAIKDLFPGTSRTVRETDWEHPLIREAMSDVRNADKLQGQIPIIKKVDGVETVVWRSQYKAPKRSVDEIRQLIKDVYYPGEELNVQKYTAKLEELSNLLSESKFSLGDPKAIPKSTPSETNFFEELYKAFDDVDAITGEAYGINQLYLQKVRDELTSAIGSQKFDQGTGLRDDISTSLTEYLRSVLSQVAPHIKTDEDLAYFLEPVMDFIQVLPGSSVGKLDEIRRYLSNVTGIDKGALPWQLVSEQLRQGRLTPSDKTLAAVSNFKTNVYSKVKAYTSKYGSYYGRKPKKAPWKDYYEVRYLLGFKQNAAYLEKYGIPTSVLPEGYANRQMFEALVRDSSGQLKVKNFSKEEVNLLLEDTAMRANLSRKFDNPELKFEDDVSEIFDRVRQEKITTESADEAVEAVKHTIADAAPETVAKEAYETTSVAEAAVDKVIDELAAPIHKFLNDGGDPDAARKIFGEKKWSLYEQIQKASNVPTTNAIRAQRASLRTKVTEALGKAFTAITGKARPEEFQKYYKLRTAMSGDVVKGSDFWTTFRRTGILVAPYAKGSEMIDATSAALTKNAKLLNETLGKDVAEVVTYTLDNDNVAVVMRWTGDKNTALLVKNAQNSLNSAKFDDVVFTKARELTTEERAFMESATMKELTGLMEQLQAQAADQATYLGFKFDDSTPYTKHAMRHDHHTAMWMTTNVYNRGVSSDDYDAIASAISGLDGYRQMDRGTFGTTLQDRRFRGDYWLLDNKQHPLFEYTPDKVFTSTLADGIFSNLQYQSFVDLFINETYKINGWFKTVDDLKKVLYAKLDNGKMSGNLQNLELVSYKTDANGKITGLIKYDKMSDEGLAKALKDKNTILVPANSVSHMDNILRKDIRASNKFWSFINKHFTIPFKFGLLSNPGFLLGNVGDAYFKLATTMSQKYGTSFASEAKGVAESINTVIHLKNTYSEVFQEWLKVVDENSLNIADEARIPEIVAMTPKYKDMFLQWLNGDLKVKARNPATKKLEEVPIFNDLAKSQIDEARVYMMLQGMQMNSNKLREYADLAGLAPTSDFDVPSNMWDRVTQGKGSYRWNKPSTWGIFMNNPVMKAFTDASGGWEELIRTASIVDDLKHKAYSIEDLSEYSKYLSPDLGESRRLFDVHLEEAKNTMFNAQFDYERVNNFFDGIGKVVPFPIFFLKNFQYWMDVFMRNPQFVDNVIDVQEGLWSGHNEKDDKFMKEAKGRGAIPVQGDALPNWFKGVYKPSPLQSMFGAFNLLNSPLDNLTYRVNPLVSGTASVIGQATGDPLTTLSDSESIKYRPYSTDMYERNIKLGDEEFNPINYTVHRMNPFDRSMNAWLRAPGKMKEGEFQLSDALPSVFQPIF